MTSADRPAAQPAMLPWRVVVPVKQHAVGKSRLVAPQGVSRSALAHAMAQDTVHAAARAVGPAAVVVVTSDETMTTWSAQQEVTVVADPGGGLNEAVIDGLTAARPGPVAVLLGDLPALHPEHLRRALAACAQHPVAFVPDRSGAGTALLASTGPELVPRFGVGSARAHANELGAVRLELPVDGMRQDVDDAADLAAAVALGVGAHTAAVLHGSSARRADPYPPSPF